MAFGKIGIDRKSFWAMTPREFFNAWQGYSEAENERMEAMQSVIFGAARYNAANTAMSTEASRAISRQKFPWEKGQQKGDNDSVRAFIRSQKRKLERKKRKGND